MIFAKFFSNIFSIQRQEWENSPSFKISISTKGINAKKCWFLYKNTINTFPPPSSEQNLNIQNDISNMTAVMRVFLLSLYVL